MEIKFFTEEKELNLSGQKITVQDSNSRMSDKMFSKYFFPFEIYMNDEFVNAFGDYESDDSSDLQNEFEGVLLFENKIHQAKLKLGKTKGKLISGQIDFGFEDLPNFNKKLSELPLHKFSVPDIHTYAKEICAKNYPETDFNFPRMYTKKYSPDEELWDAFNGYYNDLKSDGSEMNRNYIDGEGNIFNQNIIHPTPHFLYVLKTGFADAGLTLQGDILNDPIFSQRWIFSGTEYFSRLTQRRLGLNISLMDYDERYKNPLRTYPYGIYRKEIQISRIGKYKVIAHIKLNTYKSGLDHARIIIYLNGVNILHQSTDGELNFTFQSDITTTTENETLLFRSIIQTLSGEGNAGKIWHTKDIYAPDGTNLTTLGWTIKPIDQNIKEFVETQISIANKSDSAVSSAVGIHKSLAGISGEGKADSGSEQLYAYLMYKLTGVRIPEMIVMEMVNNAIKINFPEKNLKLGFFHEEAQKQEDQSSKDRPKNKDL